MPTKDHCQWKYRDSLELEQMTRDDVKAYICNDCNFIQLNESKLIRHLRNQHLAVGPLKDKYTRLILLKKDVLPLDRSIETNMLSMPNKRYLNNIKTKPSMQSVMSTRTEQHVVPSGSSLICLISFCYPKRNSHFRNIIMCIKCAKKFNRAKYVAHMGLVLFIGMFVLHLSW